MNLDEADALSALIVSKLDGTIPDADHARLERLLADCAEARRLWFLYCDIDTGMADWAAVRRESALQKAAPFPMPAPGGARRRWRWLAPLAGAAVVMLAAMWWMHGSETQPSSSDAAIEEPRASGVAVLARAVGVEWADGLERAPGMVLGAGPLRLKSGAALVEFFSGARVVLEGPTEFQLLSPDEAFLRSGKINAHVPPQARGFAVDSPEVKVVDLGTDFGFTVGRGAAPEVHVFAGKVNVASAKDSPRPLNEGEGARLDAGSFVPIPAMRSSFLSEGDLARRDAAFGLQRLSGWREASRALGSENATAVHYTFDQTDSPDRGIANGGGRAPPQAHGVLVGSAWTEGRWPGKRALQFRNQGDRIRFSLPQAMDAVTLLAWVRVDSLPRGQNMLLSSDSEPMGALRWLLTNRGELRLEIARDLGRPRADWEAVNSAPFVLPERFGQWLLLATTFDGKAVRHYGNGELIGTGASFTPPSLLIGNAEVGNWRGATQRHLSAAMDEFAVLSRVMSREQLRQYFEHGKP